MRNTGLAQCFSHFNVLTNCLGIVLKGRCWWVGWNEVWDSALLTRSRSPGWCYWTPNHVLSKGSIYTYLSPPPNPQAWCSDASIHSLWEAWLYCRSAWEREHNLKGCCTASSHMIAHHVPALWFPGFPFRTRRLARYCHSYSPSALVRISLLPEPLPSNPHTDLCRCSFFSLPTCQCLILTKK